MALYIIDKSIIEQINLGNAEAATRFKRVIDAKHEVWMTYEDDRYFRTIPANRRFVNDLNIQSPLRDDDYDNNWWYRMVLDTIPAGSAKTAALALSKKGRVMTMEPRFAQAFRPYGELEDMSSVDRISPRGVLPDYNRARRLMKLPELNISYSGNIIDPPPAGTGAPPKVVGSGGGNNGNKDENDKQQNQHVTVEYPNPKVQPGISPGPDAAMQLAASIGLQAINWRIQQINDNIQKKRLEERWAKLKPAVEAQLQQEPTWGVLIMVYYSRRRKQGAENDSPMEFVAEFQDIVPLYGYTVEDAMQREWQTSTVRTGKPAANDYESTTNWWPPKQQVDVSQLPTPFGKYGIGTFAPGEAVLTKVKFSGYAGFDDRMISREEVSVPAGVAPRFFILQPPDEINFLWNGSYRSVDIDYTMVYPSHVADADLTHTPVPCVDLDSRVNPNSARAAMVFPVDNATRRLFQGTSPTQDDNGMLAQYSMSLVRWVKPQYLCLLEDLSGNVSSMHVEY